jgi:hypothetical protein
MLTVYIAGPITGVDDHHVAFNHAAERWRDAGWTVINPVELDPTTHKPREVYMKQDLAHLVTCDAIAFLPGWETSEGAQVERTVADACGIRKFDARSPAIYASHPYEANVCCFKPDFVHEEHWYEVPA